MAGGAYLGWHLCLLFVWGAMKPYKTQAIGGVLGKRGEGGRSECWPRTKPGPKTLSLRTAPSFVMDKNVLRRMLALNFTES